MRFQTHHDDGRGVTSSTDETKLVNREFVESPFFQESLMLDTLVLKSNGNWPSDVGGTITMIYDSLSSVVDSFNYLLFGSFGIQGGSSEELHFNRSQLTVSSNTFDISLDSLGLTVAKFFYRYYGSGKDGTGPSQGSASRDFTGKIYATSRLSVHYYKNIPVSSVNLISSKNSDFTIFPNPASKTLSVVLPAAKNIAFTEIFDILGRKILSAQNREFVSPMQINISSLPPGIYYLRAGNQMQKFVIQR